jgi:hypothetical protein
MGSTASDEDPVVIVGFSFRFPQDAVTEDGFWGIIRRGTSTMTEVPPDRYNIDGFHANGKARHGTVSIAISLSPLQAQLVVTDGSLDGGSRWALSQGRPLGV